METHFSKNLQAALYNRYYPIKLLNAPKSVNYDGEFECQLCGTKKTLKPPDMLNRGCSTCNLSLRYRIVAVSLLRAKIPFTMNFEIGQFENEPMVVDFYLEDTKTCIQFIGGDKFDKTLKNLKTTERTPFVYRYKKWLEDLKDFCKKDGLNLVLIKFATKTEMVKHELVLAKIISE